MRDSALSSAGRRGRGKVGREANGERKENNEGERGRKKDEDVKKGRRGEGRGRGLRGR